MAIAVLIGIMVAIVVGVSLIPSIMHTADTIASTTTTVSAVTQTGTSSSVVGSLAGVLPFIAVAAMLLGGVAWIGFRNDSEPKEAKTKRNSKCLVKAVEAASYKLLEYQNDLDKLLGIETENKDTPLPTNPLTLLGSNILWVNDYEYDWYLTAKHSTETAFKVVGLHKEDKAKNIVYILGKNSSTKLPYLIEEKDVEGALKNLDNIGITLPGSEAEASGAVSWF